jgi:hypothetical protein
MCIGFYVVSSPHCSQLLSSRNHKPLKFLSRLQLYHFNFLSPFFGLTTYFYHETFDCLFSFHLNLENYMQTKGIICPQCNKAYLNIFTWRPYVFVCNNCKQKFSNRFSFLKIFVLKTCMGCLFFLSIALIMFSTFAILKNFDVNPKTAFVSMAIATFSFFIIGAFMTISLIKKVFPLTPIQ